MKVLSKSLAAMVAAATLVGGGAFAVAGTAYAADNDAITVTPNPWYANSFDGWGTSLAWFANATGSLGEESAITTNLGDDASKAKAVEYGKQLREQFYQSIFGDEGLDLNMARYNVGGGNASDVAYGYPFMRQGAAVPGTWKDDATGSGTYGNGVTTKQTKTSWLRHSTRLTTTSMTSPSPPPKTGGLSAVPPAITLTSPT